MKNYFLIIGLILSTIKILSQPVIAPPTQTDVITIDAGTPGSADPNDRIQYKVTIQNTGSLPALLIQLNAVVDPRTTLVPGSFRTSPLALDDAYTSLGNVGITVPDGASDLMANDYDDNPAGLTLTAGTFTTTQGGSITINANGSFSYNPARGFEGTDTYVYTLNDGNAVSGVTSTNTGTVTITIAGMIWFINNNVGACASNCDGRWSNPYVSTTAFNTDNTGIGLNPADNDNIFIYANATAYTGGIVLRNGQKLFGQDITVTLAIAAGLTVPPFSNALPVTNGASAPEVNITNGSGEGVTMATDNTMRGFTVGNCSDFGMDNTTTNSVGNLVISEVTINNTTGGGFDASNGSGASMNVVFSSLTSNGGVNGIDLTSCAGTFTVNGGTITNPTGTGVMILNGSVIFSSSGVITDNTGFAVDVDNHDSNNVTFSGNITSTGTGIRVQNCGGGTKTFSGGSKSLTTGASAGVTLTSNAGATITISGGGLVITTTSGTGFNATGGATAIDVTGTGNTITSTTGVALNVVSTTIGASNLNFLSISSNGSSNGIILNTTGGSGGLIVTGDGGAASNGSGGTIQNTTGHGINVSNVAGSLNLGYMNITNPGLSGIQCAPVGWVYGVDNSTPGVHNFTLNHCQLSDNAGNNTLDDGLTLENASGTVSITNSSMASSRHQGITIDNYNTNIASLLITASSVTATPGGDGILIQMRGNSVMTTGTIGGATAALGNTIANNSATGLQINNGDSGNILSMNVQNNTVKSNNAGMDFDISQGASMNIVAQNDSIIFCHTNALNTVASTSSTSGSNLTVTFRNNRIGIQGVLDSGSAIGTGIRVANGGIAVNLTIDGNIIRECPNGRGIDVEPQAYIPTLNVKAQIINNVILRPTGTLQDIGCGFHVPCPSASIFVLSDNNGGAFAHICTKITGNTAYDPTSWPVGGEAAFYFARRTTTMNTLTLEGNTGLTPKQNILANNMVTNFVAGDFFDEGAPAMPVVVVAAGTCGAFP